MAGEGVRRRWRPRVLALATAVAGIAFATTFSLSAVSVADSHGPFDLPVDPSWLQAEAQSALNVGQFTNHTVPASVAARDQNNAACPRTMPDHSQADYCRQEYIVVWAGKQNAADFDGTDLSDFIQNMTINPEGLAEMAVPQFVPGMDALAVIDARKYNACRACRILDVAAEAEPVLRAGRKHGDAEHRRRSRVRASPQPVQLDQRREPDPRLPVHARGRSASR